MKRSDATAALSWANDTRATSDTRITATEFRILCVIAGGCSTRATIAAAAGCGESTIPRAVRRLEKIGALKRIPGEAGKANTYEVYVRPDTGVAADTRIATRRVSKNTRIAKVQESSDTGAAADTGDAVDNIAPLIRNASARVENNSSSIELELYPETVELTANSRAREAAPKILNGSAKGMLAHDLARKLIEVIDSPSLDARSHGLFKTCGVIRQWIDDGADFDADIVPTVAALCERKNGEPIQTYRFFTRAVRDAAKTRLTIEREASNPITANEITDDKRPSHSYARGADYGRGKRNLHTDLLLRDVLDDQPVGDGRLDFSASK